MTLHYCHCDPTAPAGGLVVLVTAAHPGAAATLAVEDLEQDFPGIAAWEVTTRATTPPALAGVHRVSHAWVRFRATRTPGGGWDAIETEREDRE